MRSLLLLSPLLLLTACAEPNATAPASTGYAPAAVDLGSSSRVPHAAGRAGEGEGYETVQQPRTSSSSAMVDHSQMDHSQMDHSQMDHSRMDHSRMDHSQ